MLSNEEKIKRLKWKLQLYGSYKRELEEKEHEYFECLQELRFNNMPVNAAKNIGLTNIDPYHPAEQKIIHEKHSFPSELEALETEINYLGLNDMFDTMTAEERFMFDEYYIHRKTYQEIGNAIPCEKSTVYKRMQKVLNGNTFPSF